MYWSLTLTRMPLTNINENLTTISLKMDIAFNIIFAMEAVVKIIAMGFFMDKGSYFEPWNVLDFFIVSIIDWYELRISWYSCY